MQKAKKTRHSLNVECSLDTGVPAVFFCSRCKKPFCEDCIGRDSALKVLCLHCAVVEDSKKEKSQRASLFSIAEKKNTFFSVLGVIATIAIVFNIYILYGDFQESSPTKSLEPKLNIQLMDITKCRLNLEELVKEAGVYQEAFGHPPSSLDDLASLLDNQANLQDPTTLEPYVLDIDASGNITAHCPTPDAHGVSDIMAVPHRPARIIYRDR